MLSDSDINILPFPPYWDGPLEKLWEGRGIFEAQEFFSLMFPVNEYFFFVKMLCTNIFFSLK